MPRFATNAPKWDQYWLHWPLFRPGIGKHFYCVVSRHHNSIMSSQISNHSTLANNLFWQIQYGYQVAILRVASLTINRLLPISTVNRHMKIKLKFQSKVDLHSGNHVVYWQWIQYTPSRPPAPPPAPAPPTTPSIPTHHICCCREITILNHEWNYANQYPACNHWIRCLVLWLWAS